MVVEPRNIPRGTTPPQKNTNSQALITMSFSRSLPTTKSLTPALGKTAVFWAFEIKLNRRNISSVSARVVKFPRVVS
jgi:hypothetical protein